MSIKHGTNRFFDRVDPSTGGGDSFWERDAGVVNLVNDANDVAIGVEVMTAGGERLRVAGGIRSDTSGYLELATGAAVAVSPVGSGRFRYNEALTRLEFSENGGAYQPFGASLSPWTVTAGVIHPVVLANQVAIGTNVMAGTEQFRVLGVAEAAYLRGGLIPAFSAALVVAGVIDNPGANVETVAMLRTNPILTANETIYGHRVEPLNLAGDDNSLTTVAYFAAKPNKGNTSASATALVISGDRTTSEVYNTGILCTDQDLVVATVLLGASGNGPDVRFGLSDGATDGRGGDFIVTTGDAQATTAPGAYRGGNVEWTLGNAASIGAADVDGADFLIRTGDAASTSGVNRSGGDFRVTAGQGAGPFPRTGRFIVEDLVAGLALHWYTDLGGNFLVGFSDASGYTNFKSERSGPNMDGPPVQLIAASGNADSLAGGYDGGDVTVAAGAGVNLGAFGGQGGNVVLSGGVASSGGPAAVGGSVLVNLGVGAGGGSGGVFQLLAALGHTGAFGYFLGSGGTSTLILGSEGWAYVGSASDAVAQGDFAAGIGGQGRMFFDQSATTLALYTALNAQTVTLDATTNAGYVGIGAAATAPTGTESLQVVGDAYITGKLTVDGAIDPISVRIEDKAAGTGAFYEAANGDAALVSSANEGRLRYSVASQRWEVSENTGPWTPFTSGTGGTVVILGTFDCAVGDAVLDAVYISAANTVAKSDASNAAKMPCVGFIISKPTGTTCVVQAMGPIGGFTITSGAVYYVSGTTPGGIVTTRPAAPATAQSVGVALNTTTLGALVDLTLGEVTS